MSLSLTDQTELRLPEWKKKKVSAEYHISHEAYQPFSSSFSTWIQKSRPVHVHVYSILRPYLCVQIIFNFQPVCISLCPCQSLI